MSDFETFKSCYSDEEANALSELLERNGIETKVEKPYRLDPLIGGSTHDAHIFVLIRANDFERANEIIDQQILSSYPDLPRDYYLFSFSDVELMEIVQHGGEWNRQDQLIAKKILEERGYVAPNTIKKASYTFTESGNKFNPWWVVIPFLTAMAGVLLKNC